MTTKAQWDAFRNHLHDEWHQLDEKTWISVWHGTKNYYVSYHDDSKYDKVDGPYIEIEWYDKSN